MDTRLGHTFYGGSDASGTMAGGWCSATSRGATSTSQPAWETIALYRAGIVPVTYRRVPCRGIRAGDGRFTVQGHSYFELVTVATSAAVAWWRRHGSGPGLCRQGGWLLMSRNWGANWQSNAYLDRQGLSFRLRSDDGRVVTAYDVVPAGWSFGATYTSNAQF